MTLLWEQRLCLFVTSWGFSALTLLWEQRLCLFLAVVFGFDFAVGAPALPFTLEALVFTLGINIYATGWRQMCASDHGTPNQRSSFVVVGILRSRLKKDFLWPETLMIIPIGKFIDDRSFEADNESGESRKRWIDALAGEDIILRHRLHACGTLYSIPMILCSVLIA